MWSGVDVDGRSVAFLRRRTSILGGYDVLESGLMSHDGECVWLIGDNGRRVITDTELAALQPVTSQNRIAACVGHDYFVI